MPSVRIIQYYSRFRPVPAKVRAFGVMNTAIDLYSVSPDSDPITLRYGTEPCPDTLRSTVPVSSVRKVVLEDRRVPRAFSFDVYGKQVTVWARSYDLAEKLVRR